MGAPGAQERVMAVVFSLLRLALRGGLWITYRFGRALLTGGEAFPITRSSTAPLLLVSAASASSEDRAEMPDLGRDDSLFSGGAVCVFGSFGALCDAAL